MSNFTFNINDNLIEYTSKINYLFYEKCGQSVNQIFNIQLLNNDPSIFSFLNSYNGDAKSKLIITSFSSSDNSILGLYNGGTEVLESDMPLEIDISSLNNTDNVTGLTVIYNNNNLVNDATLNISFHIEDINGVKGESVRASFQFRLKNCTALSSVTSTLPISSNTSGFVNYTITGNNNPISYTVENLPNGISYFPTSGLVIGNSVDVGVHPINIKITNAAGISTTASTIQIINNTVQAPVITSPLAVNGNNAVLMDVSQEDLIDDELAQYVFNYRIEAINNPTSFSYNLPQVLWNLASPKITEDLLRLNTAYLTPGNYSILISASNAAGTDTETLILTIL